MKLHTDNFTIIGNTRGPVGNQGEEDVEPLEKFVAERIINLWQDHTDLDLEDLKLCHIFDICKNKKQWSEWSSCSACRSDKTRIQKRKCRYQNEVISDENCYNAEYR